jgi:hypothetical protein
MLSIDKAIFRREGKVMMNILGRSVSIRKLEV